MNLQVGLKKVTDFIINGEKLFRKCVADQRVNKFWFSEQVGY